MFFDDDLIDAMRAAPNPDDDDDVGAEGRMLMRIRMTRKQMRTWFLKKRPRQTIWRLSPRRPQSRVKTIKRLRPHRKSLQAVLDSQDAAGVAVVVVQVVHHRSVVTVLSTSVGDRGRFPQHPSSKATLKLIHTVLGTTNED